MERGFHDFHRGEVYYADLEPVFGHEQGGVRPVLIVQNDMGNYHSPTIIVIAVTKDRQKAFTADPCVTGRCGGTCSLSFHVGGHSDY